MQTVATADAVRIAAYEAWAQRLEATLERDVEQLQPKRRFFLALMAAGVACFAFGLHVGVWGSFSAAVIGVGGYAMLRVRLWELCVEIDQVRGEIERMEERVRSVTPKSQTDTKARSLLHADAAGAAAGDDAQAVGGR